MSADAIDIETGRHAMRLARSEWDSRGLKPLSAHLGSMIENDAGACFVDGQWFVLSVEPRQEELARGELAHVGLVPYLPLIPKRERHGRGRDCTRWRSMFGPYMFVKCLPSADHWNKVTSARGVRRLLDMNGKPLPIEEGRMEVIRLVEANNAEWERQRVEREEAQRLAKAGGRSGIVWHFSASDVVRITKGPFAGFNAELETAVDEHDRIRALVKLFGRRSTVTLSAFDIEAL